MCRKRSTVIAKIRGRTVRLDPCIRKLVIGLNELNVHTLASCCGHGRYPRTFVYRAHRRVYAHALMRDVEIPRRRRFYKRDDKGFFYIPEVSRRRG